MEPERKMGCLARKELVGRPEGQARWQRREASRKRKQGTREVEKEGPQGSGRVRTGPDLGGWSAFGPLLEDAKTLAGAGCLLAWLVVHAELEVSAGGLKTSLSEVLPLLGVGLSVVHRFRKQEALPIRLGELELTVGLLKRSSYSDVLVFSFVANHAGECWTLLSVHYINLLHGCRSPSVGRWRKIDATVVSSVRAAVQRSLRLDSPAERSSESVEKELSSRFVSYTGEEVPKMEVL